jgi:hypothetical protein
MQQRRPAGDAGGSGLERGDRGAANGIELAPDGPSPGSSPRHPLPQAGEGMNPDPASTSPWVASPSALGLSRARRQPPPCIPSPACGRGCGSQAAGEGPRGRELDVSRRAASPAPRATSPSSVGGGGRGLRARRGRRGRQFDPGRSAPPAPDAKKGRPRAGTAPSFAVNPACGPAEAGLRPTPPPCRRPAASAAPRAKAPCWRACPCGVRARRALPSWTPAW